MLETSDYVYGSAVWSLSIVMSECSLSGRGQGHVSNFYIVCRTKRLDLWHEIARDWDETPRSFGPRPRRGPRRIGPRPRRWALCPRPRRDIDSSLDCLETESSRPRPHSWHPACKKTEWWGVGMVICLALGADLHTAQLMPLPLTVSCFSRIQNYQFCFLYCRFSHSGLRCCWCSN